MNPRKFHTGQKVTPNAKFIAKVEYGVWDGKVPNVKFGEIYTVDKVFDYPDQVWGITLCELGRQMSFNEDRFDPVDLSSEDIEEVVKDLQPIEKCE